MNYLNRFKQISDEAAEALQGLVSDMINKNTTNILEVGTYAGQATLRLAAAASKSPSTIPFCISSILLIWFFFSFKE